MSVTVSLVPMPHDSPLPSDDEEEVQEYVVKRDGRREPVNLDKIRRRLTKLKRDVEKARGHKLHINVGKIARKTIQQMYNGISTSELDVHAAEICAQSEDDPDYLLLAGALLVSNLEANHRNTLAFAAYAQKAYEFVDEATGRHFPLISEELYQLAQKYGHLIDRRMDMSRNLLYDFFAMQTLLKGSYLLSSYEQVHTPQGIRRQMVPFETPQHMDMRAALFLYGDDLEKAFELYDVLSTKQATLATPTKIYAGTPHPSCVSCFLVQTKADSIAGIYDTLKEVALISKGAGGVGVTVSNIRAAGSYIAGTNGRSNGIRPMLRVFNDTALYVDQCFHPDTIVYTTQGPKPIKRVVPNDRLITQDGTPQLVRRVLTHHVSDEPLLTIHFPEGPPLRVTTEHPLFVENEWQEAKSLKPGDNISFPAFTFEEDVPSLTLDDCRFLGIWCQDGWIHEGRGEISFGSQDRCTFLKTYCTDRGVPYSVLAEDNLFSWTPSVNIPTPTYTENIPAWILHLPQDKLAAFWSTYEPRVHIWDKPDIFYLRMRLGLIPLHQRIVSIETTTYKGLLYDFEMETNHSYVTHGGLAHNGGGKRKGSFAVYLEPWHADIHEFLDMKRITGKEEERARSLFYALWIPDLFMKRLNQEFRRKQDVEGRFTSPPVMWSLFCPNEAPGLTETWGEAFETLYEQYEREKRYRRQVPIRDLYIHICSVQIETGTPYMVYKDTVNRLSNQQNVGMVKSSNLCVHPDTPLLTQEHGYRPIGSLKDQSVSVWNGQEWSPVVVRQTQDWCEQMMTLTFNDYFQLTCTMYHKFYLHDGMQVAAQDLRVGDILETWTDHHGSQKPEMKLTKVEVAGPTPTFCVNEPRRHRAVFNGILTGNCAEIVEHSTPEITASCNLASISLPEFVCVEDGRRWFDYEALGTVVRVMTTALGRVIDKNCYPTETTQRSNFRERPIGLGVQGLADVFCKLRLPYDSEEARVINRRIFQRMYWEAIRTSCDLAREHGAYPSIDLNGGSPLKQGRFHYELYREHIPEHPAVVVPDWDPECGIPREFVDTLRADVKQYGTYYSLHLALMPTASTSQIMGNQESFEPYYGIIFGRLTKSGEFTVINRYFVDHMKELGLWQEAIHPRTHETYIPLMEEVKSHNGSVQHVTTLPPEVRAIYKTIHDIELRHLTVMAAERQPWVDQAMSLNVHFKNKDDMMPKMVKYDLFSWKLGLKTGSYYKRTIQVLEALNFANRAPIQEREEIVTEETNDSANLCVLGGPDCQSCSA